MRVETEDVTLPGTDIIIRGVPKGTPLREVYAEARRQGADIKVTPGEDAKRGAMGGAMSGLVSALTTPAKAVVGAAGRVADMVGSDADFGPLAGKIDNLDRTMRDALPATAYQPQGPAGKFASAVSGGAAVGLASGGPTGALVRALAGGVSGAASEGAATAGLPPWAQVAASTAPNLLMAGKEALLPNKALQAIKGASSKEELAAALAKMKAMGTDRDVPVPGSPDTIPRPGVPIYPGQAFGPGSQMEGIQNQVLATPGVGPKLKQKLRDQETVVKEATASGLDPSVDAPRAPYRQAYDAAGNTPVSPSEANALAVALGKAGKKGNPVGGEFQETAALANEPMRKAGDNRYLPVENLAEVQNIRSHINESNLSPPAKDAMRGATDDFLRTKDGRFASADTVHKELMEAKAASELGRGNMGSPALDAPGNNSSVPGTAVGAIGGLGALAARPILGAVLRNRQAAELSRVMSDPTGAGLIRASQYSAGGRSLDELARALLQSQVSQQTGSGQGY